MAERFGVEDTTERVEVKGYGAGSLQDTQDVLGHLKNGRELNISKKVFAGGEEEIVSMELEFEDLQWEQRKIAVSRGKETGIIDIKTDFTIWSQKFDHICAVDFPHQDLKFRREIEQIGEPGSSLVQALLKSLENGPYHFKYIDIYINPKKMRIMPANLKNISLSNILKVIEKQFIDKEKKHKIGEKDIFNKLLKLYQE